MRVPTDDIHDLFDNEEADEPDDSAGVPEAEFGSDESDESAEWNEFPLREDEESEGAVDLAQDEAVEPTPTASEDIPEGDPSEPEMDWSTTSSGAAEEDDADGAVEDDVDDYEPTGSTMSFEGAVDDDADGFGPIESSISSEESVEDDAGEPAPAGSTIAPDDAPTTTRDESASDEAATASSTETTDDDTAEDAGGHEREESRTTPSAGALNNEPDDASDSIAPSKAPSGESIAHDAGESRLPETTTSTEQSIEDDPGETEPTAPTTMTSEGAAEDDVSEPRTESTVSAAEAAPEVGAGEIESTDASIASEDASPEERVAPRSDAASADKATGDDQSTSEGVEAATTTDGPVSGDLGAPDDQHESRTTSLGAHEATASGKTSEDEAATSQSGSNRLPTGIDLLDRAMGGGIPPGRLVLLVADPGVQSELIVDSILAQRDTLYVTTDRPDWEVMKDIEPGLGSGEVNIREHTPDSLLSGVDLLLDELGTSSNFVLDSVNELELVPRQRYRIFLSDVKQRLFETGSLGLMTGVTVGHESARDLTLRRADIVLQLETRTTDHEIENRLSVPKFRGGAAMTETVKLELTDEVRVDTDENRR